MSALRTTAAFARVAVLAAACAILLSSAAAADGSSGTLEYFDGGSLRSEVSLSLGFLYGAGSRPDGLGAPVSTVRSGLAASAGNPAGLAYIESGGVMLDVVPPLGASVSDIANLETRARDIVDDSIDDVAAYGMRPTYPELEALAGQRPGVASGAMALRLGRFVAGVSLEEPLALELDLVENGIEAFAGGVKSEGEGDVDVEMRAFADAACDLSFGVDRATAAVAGEVAPGLAVGASLSRYHAVAAVDAVLRADGIVDYGGQEYSFNDEADPWDNELGGSMTGSFEGDAIGWSLGASCRKLEWLVVDVHYVRAPRLELEGSLVTVESMPPAATDDGIELSEVSASQPTLTETTVDATDGPLTLLLPSYAGAAATARWGRVLATVEYRLFDGGIGFEHEDYAERVELSHGVGVELDLGGVWLGGGVIAGRTAGDHEEGAEETSLVLPTANLGMGMEFGEHVGVDLLVLALPMQVARVTVSYGF